MYIDNLHSSNILLREYYTEVINDIANYVKNFSLVQLDAMATLANNPAYKIVWTQDEVKNGLKLGESKTMMVFTILGDKAYILRYDSDLSKYSKYLPIAQKMIDSFQVSR